MREAHRRLDTVTRRQMIIILNKPMGDSGIAFGLSLRVILSQKESVAMPGGRQKGIPNHRSMEFRRLVDEACKKQNFDLIGSTVEMARTSKDESIRIQARRILTDHAYPRLKSIEYQGDVRVSSGFKLVINRSGLSLSDQELLD